MVWHVHQELDRVGQEYPESLLLGSTRGASPSQLAILWEKLVTQYWIISLFLLGDLETGNSLESYLCFSWYVISIVAMEMLCDGP